MKSRTLVVALYPGVFIVGLFIYLYTTAPPPLQTESPQEFLSISSEQLFWALASENNEFRTTFTRDVVGAGEPHQLQFNEDWQHPDVVAGPLPALFLRAISVKLRRANTEVGLFLGSDFPIERSNAFSPKQLEKFKILKETGQPLTYFDETTQLYTAMFPDYATAAACVTCHNEHQDSPRTDWELGDLMGATTWTFPRRFLSAREALDLVEAFREAAGSVWEDYLDKVAHLADPPAVGQQWPKEGYYLPTREAFVEECAMRSGARTLRHLLNEPELAR